MAEIDWYEIKFLESSSNLKEVIKSAVGRSPSTEIANEIAVCIRQGRLFFEAAVMSPLEIQPLQIFYGVSGFARAIVLSQKLSRLCTLAQSHGLTDVTAANAKLEQLVLKVQNKGAFQQFNDALAPLGRIYYHDDTMPTWAAKPFGGVAKLSGSNISIKEILSRVPRLEDLYRRTFREPAKTHQIDIHLQPKRNGLTEFRIDDDEIFDGRDSLAALVSKWRNNYPFFRQCRLTRASRNWGKSILIFQNIDKGEIDDLSEEYLVDSRWGFEVKDDKKEINAEIMNFNDLLPPLSGGIANRPQWVTQPVRDVYLSEYTLQYMGSYLLSSLVRYRPQIWQHAIFNTFLMSSSSDDRCLALIQRFLEIILEEFPKMVVHSIDYSRVE